MVNEGSSSDGRPLVDEDEDIWRGINPEYVKWEPDGTCRLSSGAFISRPRNLSVLIASKTTPQECMARNRKWVGLVAVPTAFVMSLGHEVLQAPRDDNPAHAEILVPLSKGKANQIAQEARWIVHPPEPKSS